MDYSVTGIQPSAPPENDINKPAELNFDKNESDEYEDKSEKLVSRMSDALDGSTHLDQAFWKIYKKDGKMEERSYQICSTSTLSYTPFPFDKNISMIHKDSEKVNLPPEYKRSRWNSAKDELKNFAFDHRIKTGLFGLAALILLGLACFALVWIGMWLGPENSNGMTHISNASTQREIEELRNNLDAEIKQRLKTESDKALTQREIEELRNSLDAEIKERRKAESELKLAVGNLEELRRDKVNHAIAELAPTRPLEVGWLSYTLIVLALLVLNVFITVFLDWTWTGMYLLSLCLLGVVWYYSALMWLFSTFIVMGLFGFAFFRKAKHSFV